MNSSPSPSVADRIAWTLGGLARAVAACSDRRRVGGALATWLITLIWTRVRRTEGRILRLLARFQAGRLPVTRARVARTRSGGGGRRGGGRKGVPLHVAWLLPLIPAEAANFASQLRATLGEPEMVALLEASAQARRVLAPLCRMLGIEKALLTPGDRLTAPAAAAEAAPEPAVRMEAGDMAGLGRSDGRTGLAFGWPLPQPP